MSSATPATQVGPEAAFARSLVAITATTAAMVPLLMLIRARVLGHGLADLRAPHLTLPKVVVASYYDLGLIAGLALTALALVCALRRRERAVGLVTGALLGLSLVVLAVALVNVPAVEMLRRPFTYSWFYYSDFLQSQAAARATSALLTPRAVGAFALAIGTFLGLRYALMRIATRWVRRIRPRWMGRLALGGGVLSLLYFAGAGYYLATRAMWHPGVLENPVVAFARSLGPSGAFPIFTMDPGVDPSDVLVASERPGGLVRPASGIEAQQTNVLVVILESAGAPYLDLYGGTHGVGARMAARRADMRVFTSVYAHVPATNKAMVAILCANYPIVSYETLTRERPDLPLGCLPDELKRRGYRTGYFGSSDLRFQRAAEFLAPRGFDVIEDVNNRVCERPIIANSSEEWPHADVSDDGCTAESAAAWIEADPGAPFFAVVWTAMAHFPYHPPEPARDFGVADPFFNRYLHALDYADEVTDRLLQRLEQAGLSEQTLVVVVGDHGESFGQHGHYVHSSVYEHTAHVPFLLLQPGRFHGETDGTVGGLVDLAPTVMDLLGEPSHADWQGRSLFDPGRSGRTYFFSPWSDYFFGYREGPYKYVLNASTDAFTVFNVEADPGETRDLSAERPEARAEATARLAAWVQYQKALWDRRLGRS